MNVVRSRDAQRAAPLVEHVHDIGLAELDPDRPSPRAFRVIPLEVAIDTTPRHVQRHAFRRPPAHLLERWSDDANEVTVVPATEIRLDLPAIVFYGNHRTSPEITRARAAPSRTSSAPVSSMSSATPWRVTPAASHSTRRPNVATARPRQRVSTAAVARDWRSR